MSESKDEIQKYERQIDDIEDKIYEPVKELSPVEQKFAIMRVTTPMDRFQVGDVLGLSDSQRRRIQKKDEVKKYMKYCQSKREEQQYLEMQKQERRSIRDQLYSEIMDRMFYDEEDIEDIYPDGATEKEKEEWRQRYAKFAKFKDIMKIWDKVDKATKLDEGDVTERIDDNSIENKMKEEFKEYQKKRKEKVLGDEVEVEGFESIDEFARKAKQKQQEKEDVKEADYEEVGEENNQSETDEGSDTNLDEFEI